MEKKFIKDHGKVVLLESISLLTFNIRKYYKTDNLNSEKWKKMFFTKKKVW
jgi:hypothetical protein